MQRCRFGAGQEIEASCFSELPGRKVEKDVTCEVLAAQQAEEREGGRLSKRMGLRAVLSCGATLRPWAQCFICRVSSSVPSRGRGGQKAVGYKDRRGRCRFPSPEGCGLLSLQNSSNTLSQEKLEKNVKQRLIEVTCIKMAHISQPEHLCVPATWINRASAASQEPLPRPSQSLTVLPLTQDNLVLTSTRTDRFDLCVN